MTEREAGKTFKTLAAERLQDARFVAEIVAAGIAGYVITLVFGLPVMAGVPIALGLMAIVGALTKPDRD